jgi:hypothetical protein
VLIALGVDQWREASAERRLEQEYLLRLRADLIQSQEAVQSTSDDYEAFLAHGIAVAKVLERLEPLPSDTLGFLASALQVSRGGYDPALSRGAYDDLISTGNLRVLENEALRYRLSAFYGQIENTLSPIDYAEDKMPYRNTIRGLLPLETQLLVRAQCDGAPPLSCPSYSGAGGFETTVARVLSDQVILSRLNVALQGMAIRRLEAGVTGGFSAALAQIGDLRELVEADID